MQISTSKSSALQILVQQFIPLFKFILVQITSIKYSLSRRIMKILVKSNSSPMLNPQAREMTQLAKPRKHHLQQLENEVTKSRIAIQNMSHTRAIQNALYKRVSELQKELHHCILSINHEEEKQKILEELNHVLKSEMSQVQAAQRTQDQFMCSSYQKKIKKVEYDIKQILHKYNQEIAKINWLKEQANSARDERVVYSNLFNKIQKEIKHYEQLYRQNLIKNQIFLDQKRIVMVKNKKEVSLPPIDPFEQTNDLMIDIDENENKSVQNGVTSKKEVKIKSNKKSFAKSEKCPEHDLFITNLKQSISKQETEKTQKDMSQTSRNQPPSNWDVELMIRQKEAQVQAAIVLTQCRSLQQVLSIYGSLQQSNDNLTAQISEIDQNISLLQDEVQRQRKQKRASQVYENRQFTEMINISKKSKSTKLAVNYSQSLQTQPLQQITIQICKLLGLECENLGDDVLREIDRRIDDLGCNLVLERRGRRDSRLISAEEMSNGDRGVCQLLEKIEKFGESQKIFDKNMLRAEYQKELSKVKKKGKKWA